MCSFNGQFDKLTVNSSLEIVPLNMDVDRFTLFSTTRIISRCNRLSTNLKHFKAGTSIVKTHIIVTVRHQEVTFFLVPRQ